jgi:hypothetical protein
MRRFVALLQSEGRVSKQKLVDRQGRLVKYGSLIVSGGPFDKELPNIARRLREIHDRRNQLPGSHPYDQKGGKKNRFLKAKEFRSLKSQVRIVLDDIAHITQEMV